MIKLAWLAAFVLAFRTEGLLAAVGGAHVSARALEIAETVLKIAIAGLALLTAALVATPCGGCRADCVQVICVGSPMMSRVGLAYR